MHTARVPPAGAEPIDFVYTWVDGAWPGYAEALGTYAQRPVDLNPNRYRDNLDLLRFSLRSVERFAPWFRHIVVVTQRPQVPAWLDPSAPGLRIVHHDEFIPEAALPTFSSFAITANLCRIAGLSQRFLHVEDDFLALRELTLRDLTLADGRPKYFAHAWAAEAGQSKRDASKRNPWNVALSTANSLLDERYGHHRRRTLKHAPVLLDVAAWQKFAEAYREPLDRTTQARFRDIGTVPVEHMFPWYLWHEGQARFSSRLDSYQSVGYVGLDNWPRWLALRLWLLRLRRPRWYCLNDNFDSTPHPHSLRIARDFLQRCYPAPSRFERRETIDGSRPG